MKDIYSDLLRQYDILNDEEKNALLVYKSKIFFHINEITTIENFMQESAYNILNKIKDRNYFLNSFNEYKNIIDKPENLFVKKSIFSQVNFDNIYKFIESLKLIIANIISASNKVTIDSDIIIYRGIGIDSNKDEKNIAKGNIISTTTNIEVAKRFMFYDLNLNNILYVIKITQGSNVLVIPYSILINYNNNRLEIKKCNGISQNEIILFKDNFDFDEIKTKTVKLDNDTLTIKYIKSTPIYKDINNLKK